MNLFEYFYSLRLLQPGVLLLALCMSIPVVFLSYAMHEAAHWLAGRTFGARSKLVFLPLRGKSRVWFISIMSMKFDDENALRLSQAQVRITAIAGPVWDLFFGAMCVCFFSELPGPELVRAITAFVGGFVLFSTIIMNVVPWLKGNDGWRVLHGK